MRLALLALLLLAIGLAAVWAAMAWQFSRDVDALSVRVLGPPAAAGVPPHTPQLNGLLSRESAVPDGAVALRLRQRGEMRFGPTERWLPFEAEQLISLTKPAFLWDASVSMLPLIPVRVIDAFDGGPVGVESLAAALSEERGTLEDVIEPYLIQQGYLVRTARGRMATAKAYRHLGFKPKANGNAELFDPEKGAE